MKSISVLLQIILLLGMNLQLVVSEQSHMRIIGSKIIKKKILAKFNHYSKDAIVVLHDKTLVSYKTNEKTWKKQSEVEHKIPDLGKNFKMAKMDHSGEIFIMAEDKMYILGDIQNFKLIGNYSKVNFDKET